MKMIYGLNQRLTKLLIENGYCEHTFDTYFAGKSERRHFEDRLIYNKESQEQGVFFRHTYRKDYCNDRVDRFITAFQFRFIEGETIQAVERGFFVAAPISDKIDKCGNDYVDRDIAIKNIMIEDNSLEGIIENIYKHWYIVAPSHWNNNPDFYPILVIQNDEIKEIKISFLTEIDKKELENQLRQRFFTRKSISEMLAGQKLIEIFNDSNDPLVIRHLSYLKNFSTYKIGTNSYSYLLGDILQFKEVYEFYLHAISIMLAIERSKVSQKIKNEEILTKSIPTILDEDFIEIEPFKNLYNKIVYRNKLDKTRGQVSKLGHIVFTGNPGTGKTTAARKLAERLSEAKIIGENKFREINGRQLVAGYVGQTATLVKDWINEVIGGILFIDEAYLLYSDKHSNDFGKEAIGVLLKDMEDRRGEFLVILAGYEDEMLDLINSNPGLISRITHKINFPDYSPQELLDQFNKTVKSNGFSFFESLDESFLYEKFELFQSKYPKSFANFRGVRELVEDMIDNFAIKNKQLLDENEEKTSLDYIFSEGILKTVFESKEEELERTNKAILNVKRKVGFHMEVRDSLN